MCKIASIEKSLTLTVLYGKMVFAVVKTTWPCSSVGLECLTTNQKVAGSSPARVTING